VNDAEIAEMVYAYCGRLDEPLRSRVFALAKAVHREWPSDASDRVHQLLADLAAKELECQRLREQLHGG
jgi:hypothetical protein